ncbi:MAG: type II secretion system F family protein [Candidatus Methanomethylophilaceae archaeon]|nr:type II secretion system F family protein [Candidatus Methanomethylophilaceae archaeon]
MTMFATAKGVTRKIAKDPKPLLNEAPTVIGMMSVIIESGGSLDSAVRDVAANGPRISSALFRDIVRRTDTRSLPDIKTGLSSALTSLPEPLSPFRRSLHMIMAAAESTNRNEKARMLKDSSDISLQGLREAGESYSSSLNTPCMMVFGLGIMVPMILMSILPMLSIGGVFGKSPISTELVAIITLVAVPAVIVALILSIREKNPFMMSAGTPMHISKLLPAVVGIPAGIAVWMLTNSLEQTISVGLSAAGAGVFAGMYSEVRAEKIRAKQERSLKDSVFDLGNRLISGENFETALIAALSLRKECKPVAESAEREIAMCRGDMCSAINASLGKISGRVAGIYCDIYRCSQKDIRDAGRLAVSVGRQLQDQDAVLKGIGNKLKSMTDMMVGTAMVFAPLVLGMSVSMLSPISKIAGAVGTGGTTLMLTAYLGELCILMSFLSAYLNGRPEPKDIVFRAGMMLPVSMVVFTVCCGISF